MKKVYEAHEREYRRMRAEGIQSWSQRSKAWAIDPHDKRFLEDVFAQPWAPQGGRTIELGCGTGPLIRWLSKKGFTATGIDISRTAIEMAKALSKEYEVAYRVSDVCSLDPTDLGKYDLCIDGRFLHCITNLQDRKAVLRNVRHILMPGGVFILMSMCFPIDRRGFANLYKNQRILDNVIYVPAGNSEDFQDSRIINGKKYIPTRFVAHWQKLLSELRGAGFLPMLVRHNHCVLGEPVSSLNVAALTKRCTATR